MGSKSSKPKPASEQEATERQVSEPAREQVSNTESAESQTVSICSKIQNVKCVPKGLFCCTRGGTTVVLSKNKNVSLNISN